MMMNCYLSLGANLGDKKKNIRLALEMITKINGVELISVSHFYETEAWGVKDQPNFINAAAKIKSELQPLKLLDELQAIENKLGRVRHGKWTARTIDIDILHIDGVVMKSDRLTLPHPFIFLRDFVLVPLMEITNLNFDLNGDKIIQVDGSPIDFNFKMIACIDKNFGLSHNGKLLFKIAEDLKNFRELTLNNTIIMGRKTFESIGKVLDQRRNIILSRTQKNIAGVEVVSDLESLYKVLNVNEKNFVIGGGEIYSQILPYTSEIYLTVVDEVKAADTFLTNIDQRNDFICDKIDRRNGFEFKHYVRC